MNLQHMMYFAPDEPVAGEGTAPTTEVIETQQQAQTTEQQAGPWDADLARAFPDEATRGQVDQFLRSTVQPYVTQREQQLGEVSKVWEGLWDEDATFPTYLELANQLYGPDVAGALAKTLSDHFEAQGMSADDAAQAAAETVEQHAAQEVQQQGPPSYEEWLKTVPEEYRSLVTRQMETDQDELYEQQLDAVEKTEPSIGPRDHKNRELFSRYVASMEGDISAALALWQEEMAPLIQAHPDHFNLVEQQEQQAVVDEKRPAREAPAVLGTGAAQGQTPPPQTPEHLSMDDALDALLEDVQKKTRGSAAGRV